MRRYLYPKDAKVQKKVQKKIAVIAANDYSQLHSALFSEPAR
jgi:hypothetical protein